MENAATPLSESSETQLSELQRRSHDNERLAHMFSWAWDTSGYDVYVSDHGRDMLKLGGEKLSIRELIKKIPRDDRHKVLLLHRRAIARLSSSTLEVTIPRKNATNLILHEYVEARQEGERVVLYGVVQDVSEQRRAQEKILRLAYYDSLTGLPNRTFLNSHLDYTISRARRTNRSVAVMLADMDLFLRLKNSLGPGASDTLLQCVADRLLGCMRSSDCIALSDTNQDSDDDQGDTLARIEADQFVIVLSDIQRPEDAAIVAKRILDSLKIPIPMSVNEVSIKASIGIAIYPENGDDAETLIKNADGAMHYAQSQGRENFQFYSREINDKALERLTLEADLRNALQSNSLHLVYQPKVNPLTQQVTSAEVLIRWEHPLRGFIPPIQFIPLAEETGLILPLGEWILREACQQNQRWREQGLPAIRLAINLSATQFVGQNLSRQILGILQSTGMPAELLEVEITEGMLMDNSEATLTTLSNIREAGVHIAMDDFGTGYSSLRYLTDFPIDVLKIDRSFIQDVDTKPTSSVIVKTIIQMCENLGLQVVAEGVETKAELEFLMQNACELIQGYYFSRPLKADDFAEWIQKEDWRNLLATTGSQ